MAHWASAHCASATSPQFFYPCTLRQRQNITAISLSPLLNTNQKLTVATFSTGPNNSAYVVQRIFKAYKSDNNYSSDRNGNFTRKLTLFSELCDQNGLQDEHRSSSILHYAIRSALQFNVDTKIVIPMLFDETCASICHRFEPEDRTKALIRKWDNLSFLLVMQRDRGNSHTKCLNKNISRLTGIQTAFSEEYLAKLKIVTKLLNAFKDIPECQMAYRNPADSIHSVISDLHSASETSATSTTNQNISFEIPHYFA